LYLFIHIATIYANIPYSEVLVGSIIRMFFTYLEQKRIFCILVASSMILHDNNIYIKMKR
jgi:hypothetical protein